MKKYDQIAGFNRQRIEALSDGVFSIALTLLILDIRVPVNTAIHSEHDLLLAFSTLAPKLISYFLSFMTLGIYWAAHSTQFHYITRSDRHLSWINLFFLLSVSVIPFTTAFLSEYIHFKFAVFLYWFNLISLGLMLAINWNYAVRKEFVTTDSATLQAVGRAIKRRIIEAQTLYTFGALLCIWNAYISIGTLIAIQLRYALGLSLKRYIKKQTHQPNGQ